MEEQEGLGSGRQRRVGRWVLAHLLDAEVLRGVQEFQSRWQVNGVQGVWRTTHWSGKRGEMGQGRKEGSE